MSSYFLAILVLCFTYCLGIILNMANTALIFVIKLLFHWFSLIYFPLRQVLNKRDKIPLLAE